MRALNLDFGKILNPKTPEWEARQIVTDFCSVDLVDMMTTLGRHAGLYAYAVAACEMAKVDEARASWEKEQAKSRAFSRLVTENPKITASAAEVRIPLDAEYIAAVESYLSTRVTLARLKALVEGLGHRRDMLVQLASRQRAELSS